ncbi:MAG: EAL domain-containing protein [Burkholderiaceae bacterium]|nr:EAL domain-containing protein [Burkholderiaceae bacterium]
MSDFFHLFIAPPDSSLLYTGHYDPVLVSLSIVVAIFASYASLLVSQHVASTPVAATRRMWMAIGGLCLGLGIWAMHFVGMLAFSLPCTSSYNAAITLLSMIPSVLACTLALTIISRRTISRTQLATGGLLLGSGIGAMHYAGMAALRLEGLLRYDLKLFVLSILVAVVLATLAIWIKFRLQSWPSRWSNWVPILSATAMGLAVSGMHYMAMAAAYFVREGDRSIVDSQLGSTFLAWLVLAATGVIIVVTLVATCVGKSNLFSLGRSYKIVGLLIIGWGATAWLSANYYYNHLATNLYQEESQLARQQAENLANNIEERIKVLKGISHMVSRDEDTHRVLRRFGANAVPSLSDYKERKQRWTQDKRLGELNNSLYIAASNLGADDIFIINAAGDCIAAGNADKPTSPIGSNYADRVYFPQAQAGQPGHQYAMGRTTNVPGLFYAYPVFEKRRFLGAVVVKQDITKFSDWTNQVNAFITDASGVIVLAPDKRLEFLTLPNASVAKLSTAKRLLQYKRTELEPLAITPWGNERFPFAVLIGGGNSPVVLASKSLPEDAIAIHVPRPLGELVRLGTERYWLFILLAATGSMLIVAVSVVVLYLRESRKAAADLRIAATAFESQEGMMITDAKSVILRVNRAFTDITGYSAAEVVGKTPGLLKSGRHDAAFYTAMWETLHRTGAWQGEVWDRRKNGEVYPKWLTITAVKGVNRQTSHYVGMHADITQRKAAENEIEHLAFYDPLTRLPNRRLLQDRLQQALAACARSGCQGALLFIDLDNFKALNDTRGHDKGDLLLQQVAQRLAACMREDDTVARLGGDEFVVLLEGLNENSKETATQAKTAGEKILATLNQPYRLADYEHHSTASIGVTLFSGHRETVDELLKRADLAMYQAKAAGRNALRFFDPDMQAAVMARAALEADLREGLREKQFLLHYQGQVDEQGHLIGAEALVRWQHPRRGLVAPAEFIPLAEETGLILPLGQWVLEAACTQLVAWATRPDTARLGLAVNVSARQFRHPDFVAQVLKVLDHTGANPQKLKLELTESLLLDDVEDIIAKMTALKVRGVEFSLDDFGTGYSSLSYLKRLPLDQLKIDQSFVRDVFTDANDAAIVKTILALAQSLGLAVIAEGVETEAQRDFLAAQGCRVYQGYLFGRPGPAEELCARLSGVPALQVCDHSAVHSCVGPCQSHSPSPEA